MLYFPPPGTDKFFTYSFCLTHASHITNHMWVQFEWKNLVIFRTLSKEMLLYIKARSSDTRLRCHHFWFYCPPWENLNVIFASCQYNICCCFPSMWVYSSSSPLPQFKTWKRKESAACHRKDPETPYSMHMEIHAWLYTRAHNNVNTQSWNTITANNRL